MDTEYFCSSIRGRVIILCVYLYAESALDMVVKIWRAAERPNYYSRIWKGVNMKRWNDHIGVAKIYKQTIQRLEIKHNTNIMLGVIYGYVFITCNCASRLLFMQNVFMDLKE